MATTTSRSSCWTSAICLTAPPAARPGTQLRRPTRSRPSSRLATNRTITSEAALAKAGLGPKEIDFWEINEAFCIVALNCIQQLGLDPDKVNVNVGAIALGHPIGASGARLIVTLIHALRNRGLKTGIASLCIGGGEATAIGVEAV